MIGQVASPAATCTDAAARKAGATYTRYGTPRVSPCRLTTVPSPTPSARTYSSGVNTPTITTLRQYARAPSAWYSTTDQREAARGARSVVRATPVVTAVLMISRPASARSGAG